MPNLVFKLIIVNGSTIITGCFPRDVHCAVVKHYDLIHGDLVNIVHVEEGLVWRSRLGQSNIQILAPGREPNLGGAGKANVIGGPSI